MAKINVLDQHVAELIAAGEVVERPASVVKELVENAIDAGASSITVEIKNGGITLMRVTDNGSGIAREDVKNAFLRNATSKVLKEEDLERIGTLGFRGEALASICAVSRVTLTTRTREELAGTCYRIDGGVELSLSDAGCPVGSSFAVGDLFYNTPARMKFLKKDVSEGNAVAGVLDRTALSHPEIAFRFIRDGREALSAPGDGSLKSCVFAVYGKAFTAGLIPVDYELGGVRVTGFISKPSAARPNRSMQHFFINGRFVKSKTAMVAMEQAFKGSMMAGKFPSCALHLRLSFEAVDVNVHPSKIEVRFINEKPIFDAVYHGVKSALMAGDSRKEVILKAPGLRGPLPEAERIEIASVPILPVRHQEPAPNARQPDPAAFQKAAASFSSIGEEPELYLPVKRQNPDPVVRDSFGAFAKNALDDDARPIYPVVITRPEPAAAQLEKNQQPERGQGPEPGRDESRGGETVPEESPAGCKAGPASAEAAAGEAPCDLTAVTSLRRDEKPQRVIGEAFHTYLILEYGDDELLLIDKHAAHERILYEKLKRERVEECSQLLLEPVAVTLSKQEYTAVLEGRELLKKAGFETDDFGDGTILVRSAPLSLEHEDIASSVMEIAGYLTEHKTEVTTEKLDWLYHNIACRAAVKGGMRTSGEELASLAVTLLEHPEIRYCPHGRPVSVVLKKREIEKQFGRIPS